MHIFRLYCRKLSEEESQKQKHFLTAFQARTPKHQLCSNDSPSEELNSSDEETEDGAAEDGESVDAELEAESETEDEEASDEGKEDQNDDSEKNKFKLNHYDRINISNSQHHATCLCKGRPSDFTDQQISRANARPSIEVLDKLMTYDVNSSNKQKSFVPCGRACLITCNLEHQTTPRANTCRCHDNAIPTNPCTVSCPCCMRDYGPDQVTHLDTKCSGDRDDISDQPTPPLATTCISHDEDMSDQLTLATTCISHDEDMSDQLTLATTCSSHDEDMSDQLTLATTCSSHDEDMSDQLTSPLDTRCSCSGDILDQLTPCDLRVLVHTQEENRQVYPNY
jgi:hypothetical protein